MLHWSLKRVFGGFLSVFIVVLTLFNIRKTNSESPSNLRGKIKSIETTSFINSSSKFPFTLYGTAWKKEATASLVELALNNGFRSIDTACKIYSLNRALTHSLICHFFFKVNQNITMKRVWEMVYKLPLQKEWLLVVICLFKLNSLLLGARIRTTYRTTATIR